MEEPPCCLHDAAQIVLTHYVFPPFIFLPSLRAATVPNSVYLNQGRMKQFSLRSLSFIYYLMLILYTSSQRMYIVIIANFRCIFLYI